jgi:hypothetical protein
MTHKVLVAIALCLLSACAPSAPELLSPTRDSALVARAAGCWRLALTGLSRAFPREFVLHLVGEQEATDSGSPWLPLHVIAPVDTASRWGFNGCAILAKHSEEINISLGDGYTGVTLRLRVMGNVVRGAVHTFVDYAPAPSAKGRVHGNRDSTICS